MRNDVMDLATTVEGMLSGDRIDRLRAEHRQAWIRYWRLKYRMNAIASHRVEEPQHVKLLEAQLAAMEAYMRLLEERARQEGVSL